MILTEGVLAKSLYFQFQDGLVNLDNEMARLYDFGRQDTRYKRIGDDVRTEVSARPVSWPSMAAARQRYLTISSSIRSVNSLIRSYSLLMKKYRRKKNGCIISLSC